MVFEKNKFKTSRFALACGVAAVLSAGFAFAGCGGDDVDTNPTDDDDAAPDGTTSTTTDSGTIDSGKKDSGSDGGWCGLEPDGGSICEVGQWENTEAGACVACPSATFACVAIGRAGDGGIGVASPAFTKSSGHLVAELAPGTAQIVSGSVTVPLGQCSGTAASVDGGTLTLPISVSSDVLDAYIDGGAAPQDFEPCGVVTYVLNDACCGTHTVQVTSFYNDTSDVTDSYCDAGQ